MMVLFIGISLTRAGGASACDMMGASVDKEVELHELFARFRRLSEKKNLDGWGVALYADASATIFKEPIPAAKSRLAEALITHRLLKSKILIAHLRQASVGIKPSYRNTHPWVREVGGTEYTFAHVGGCDKRLWQAVELGRFKPIGENCAEHMFCHMVGEIEKRGNTAWDRQAFDRFHQVLATMNEVQTTSHLFSDGRHLFAYSCRKGGTWLSYVERKLAPAGAGSDGEPCEPALGILVARNGHNLAEPGEQWTRIPAGQLVVFKDGKAVYSSATEVAGKP